MSDLMFGGAGGSKKSQPVQDAPKSADDNLFSRDTFELGLAISEGEILGIATHYEDNRYDPLMPLVDRARFIYLNDTPMVNSDGSKNFDALAVGFYNGQQEATCEAIYYHLGGETYNLPVQIMLEKDVPLTRVISGATLKDLDSVWLEVKLNLSALYTLKDDNTQHPATLLAKIYYKNEYEADYRLIADLSDVVGKTTSPYSFERRFQVSNKGGGKTHVNHLIKIVCSNYKTANLKDKITVYKEEKVWVAADGEYETEYGDTVTTSGGYWKTVTTTSEIPDPAKAVAAVLSVDSIQMIGKSSKKYPDTAMLHLIGIPNGQLSGIPQVSAVYYGMILNIPNTYNGLERTYEGEFQGYMQRGWSNNPVWVLYDIIMNPRYGVRKYMPTAYVDVYEFYRAAVWCDTPERNPLTGKAQPRFTFNETFYELADIMDVAYQVASSFNAVIYDDMSGRIRLKVDFDTIMPNILFNHEIVDAQGFQYSQTPLDQRYNDITVSFINPEYKWAEDRRKLIGITTDEDSISAIGSVPFELKAVGCTNEGEAVRRARYMLVSAQRETTTVSFVTDMRAELLEPFDCIGIVDPTMDWGAGSKIIKIMEFWDINALVIEISDFYTAEGQFEARVCDYLGQQLNCVVELHNPIEGTSNQIKLISFESWDKSIQGSGSSANSRNLFMQKVVVGSVCEVINTFKYGLVVQSYASKEGLGREYSSLKAQLAYAGYLSMLEFRALGTAEQMTKVQTLGKSAFNLLNSNYLSDYFYTPYTAEAYQSTPTWCELISIGRDNKSTQINTLDATVMNSELVVKDDLEILEVLAVIKAGAKFDIIYPANSKGLEDSHLEIAQIYRVSPRSFSITLKGIYNGLVRVYYVVKTKFALPYGTKVMDSKYVTTDYNSVTMNEDTAEQLTSILKVGINSVIESNMAGINLSKPRFQMAKDIAIKKGNGLNETCVIGVGGWNSSSKRKISYLTKDAEKVVENNNGTVDFNYTANSTVFVDKDNPDSVAITITADVKGITSAAITYDCTWFKPAKADSFLKLGAKLYLIETVNGVEVNLPVVEIVRNITESKGKTLSLDFPVTDTTVRANIKLKSLEIYMLTSDRLRQEITITNVSFINNFDGNPIPAVSKFIGHLGKPRTTRNKAGYKDMLVSWDSSFTFSMINTMIKKGGGDPTNPTVYLRPATVISYESIPSVAVVAEDYTGYSLMKVENNPEANNAENIYQMWLQSERQSSVDIRPPASSAEIVHIQNLEYLRSFVLGQIALSGIIPENFTPSGEGSGKTTLRNLALCLEAVALAKYPLTAYQPPLGNVAVIDELLAKVLAIVDAAFDAGKGTPKEGWFILSDKGGYDTEAHYRIKKTLIRLHHFITY